MYMHWLLSVMTMKVVFTTLIETVLWANVQLGSILTKHVKVAAQVYNASMWSLSMTYCPTCRVTKILTETPTCTS